jgi:SAM-dependent methyltransferase
MGEPTNLADYADPVLYDAENNSFEPDGPTLLQMARQVKGRVLELGCGSGRITIPLAQQGIDIIGLDIVPVMLAHAKQKAGDLPIDWVEADVCTFQLAQRFDLIFETGSVFQHLLTRADQEACLACVRTHLVENGRFILPLAFPHPKWLTDVTAEADWTSYKTVDGRDVRVSGTQQYDPVRQVKVETAVRRWTDADGNEVVQKAPLLTRYFHPEEIAALLHYNGFKIAARYGNWDLHPLTGQSNAIIHVCELI